MKINTKSHKKSIIILIITTLILIGGVAYYVMTQGQEARSPSVEKEPRASNSVDYKPASDEQKDSGTRAKSDFIERQEQTPDTQSSGKKSAISITNTSYGENTLQVRTMVESSNKGVCRLTLSRQGEDSVTREASTQSLGSYDTCMGFDIDTKGMKKGTWTLELYYTGDDTGVTATKSVEIQ